MSVHVDIDWACDQKWTKGKIVYEKDKKQNRNSPMETTSSQKVLLLNMIKSTWWL